MIKLQFLDSQRFACDAEEIYMTFKVKKAGIILEEMQGLWEILWHFEL